METAQNTVAPLKFVHFPVISHIFSVSLIARINKVKLTVL